jgi:hypothetical protein
MLLYRSLIEWVNLFVTKSIIEQMCAWDDGIHTPPSFLTNFVLWVSVHKGMGVQIEIIFGLGFRVWCSV